LKDAQEHVEAPKRTVRENSPSRKFPNYMELIVPSLMFNVPVLRK
jgi:hypothetical protein